LLETYLNPCSWRAHLTVLCDFADLVDGRFS
jgi:hypothetical protein